MGEEGCGQFITFSLCPFSSYSLAATVWDPSRRIQSFIACGSKSPSHGLQFFMNFSSMQPFHRMQSFRNRLLQCGSPMGHKFCQQTCSTAGSSPWAAAPARSLLWPRLTMGCSFFEGVSTYSTMQSSTGFSVSSAICPSMGCKGTACFIIVSTTSCRVMSGLAPGVPASPVLLLQ